MSKATVDQITGYLEKLRTEAENRPPGYYTKRELAEAIVEAGVTPSWNGAKSRAQNYIDELRVRGVEPPKIRVRVVSKDGKASMATAYKLVEGKGKKKR